MLCPIAGKIYPLYTYPFAALHFKRHNLTHGHIHVSRFRLAPPTLPFIFALLGAAKIILNRPTRA